MISFFSLWLLLAATPLFAKSIGQSAIVINPDAWGDYPRPPLLSAASRSMQSDRLQISRKSCRGPENQLGTCMFNFQCQQQQGEVVGACLDGFLFGACCHKVAGGSAPTTSPTVHETSMQSTLSVSGLHWPTPSTVALVTDAELLSGLSANENHLLPSPTGVDRPNHEEENSSHLPLVLMFMNNNQSSPLMMATSSIEATSVEVSTEDEEAPLEMNAATTMSPDHLKNAAIDSLSATPAPHNQISATGVQTSSVDPVIVTNQGDPLLQAQLMTLLHAHTTEETGSEVTSPSPLTTLRSPSRKPQSKRPRPKPTTTTTTTTSVTETDTSQSTTVTPMSTESLAEHQANVLQFLVRDPPAWVLEELINGSSMTTWFPLPIPDEMPGAMVDHHAVEQLTPAGSTSTSTARPMKRKPTKTRPPGTVAASKEAIVETTSLTTPTSSETATIAETTTTEEPTTTSRKPRPVLDYTKDCGVRPMVPTARIVGGRRAEYGRWPWQVLIRESTWFGIFSKNKCGGVLISNRHVLTAAHCQPGFLGSLLVVLGEFDLTGHSEPNTPVEKNVKRVVVHRDYVERTFENDLAILELESPVEFKPYIVPICLPSTSDGTFVGDKAEVTGWGKLSHNGPTPGVLYEVDVPIMSNTDCHDMFKKAGHEKRILDSFVCAGYAEGKKDSCEGDSGGPLMVEQEDGRWTLVGTVSHGIRCAYPNMPGVYMRMTYYRPWIERVTGIGGSHLG